MMRRVVGNTHIVLLPCNVWRASVRLFTSSYSGSFEGYTPRTKFDSRSSAHRHPTRNEQMRIHSASDNSNNSSNNNNNNNSGVTVNKSKTNTNYSASASSISSSASHEIQHKNINFSSKTTQVKATNNDNMDVNNDDNGNNNNNSESVDEEESEPVTVLRSVKNHYTDLFKPRAEPIRFTRSFAQNEMQPITAH